MLRKLLFVTQNSIKLGAEVCAISAALAAVYAYFNPSVVSDYMVAVEEHTRRAAEAMERIDGNTAAISQDTQAISTNTEALAAAIPSWLTVSYLTVDQPFSDPYFQVDVQNDTPQQIDSVQVALKGFDGTEILKFGPYVLPPREVRNNRSKVTMPRDVTLCITGLVDGKDRMSEVRKLHVSGDAPNFKVETVDRRVDLDDALLSECQ